MGKKEKGSKRKRSALTKTSTRDGDDDAEQKRECGNVNDTVASTVTSTVASTVTSSATTKNSLEDGDSNNNNGNNENNDSNKRDDVEEEIMTLTSLGLTVTLQSNDDDDNNNNNNKEEINDKHGTESSTGNNQAKIIIPRPFHRSCLDNVNENSTIQLVKHVFHKISKQKYNYSKTTNNNNTWKPTPIQLQSWSILAPIEQQKHNVHANVNANTNINTSTNLNLIGISPTGSGKSLSYVIPLVQRAVSFSLLVNNNGNNINGNNRKVYGLIITPTRELTIQVSKVVKIVCKSVNKLQQQQHQQQHQHQHQHNDKQNKKIKKKKKKKNETTKNTSEYTPMCTVSSLAIYGGVPKSEQIEALLGNEEKIDMNANTSISMNNIIVTATPGRLIDLMGLLHNNNLNNNKDSDKDSDNDSDNDKDNDSDDDNVIAIQNLFQDVEMFIIDEADRVATQTDISKQVDNIFNFVQKKRKSGTINNANANANVDEKVNVKERIITIGLFSATLPQRALVKIDDWVSKPRVLVKVNSLTVGGSRGKDEEESSSSSLLLSPSSINKGEENTELKMSSKESNTSENDESSSKSSELTKEVNSHKKRGILNLSAIPSHVEQILHVCSNHKKTKKLLSTLSKIRDNEKKDTTKRRKGLIIVFFGRVKTLQYVYQLLQKENVQSVQLHSQMKQERREFQFNLFRSGKCPIMLATDIAARGLHVNNVEFIINYDFPGSLEQYVHRCGRAGRNKVTNESNNNNDEGADTDSTKNVKATVYSFFNRELAPMAKDVVELLRSCNAAVDPNLLMLVPAKDRGEDETCSKRKRRRNAKKQEVKSVVNTIATKDNADENMGDSDEDEFASLQTNRIVLKRASHVSDAESDSDNGSDE